MRVIIKFDKKEKILYTQNHLQGFVYNLIRNSGYGKIHDIHPKFPRFFNFSQLFLSKDSYLCFVISSPLKDLIIRISKILKKKDIVRVNNNFLSILSVSLFKPIIEPPITIKTETPIIVRIPKKNFKLYGINLEKDVQYFYWRPKPGIPLEPFVKQLEARVYKQYKLFTGKEDIKEYPIFYKFIYKKTVDVPFFYKNQKYSRPGTLWEFEINPQLSKNLINFIIDIGLGELTSQGYGFVNLVKK